MILKTIVPIFLFFLSCYYKAQSGTLAKSKQSRDSIASIYGEIRDAGTKEKIPGVAFIVKGTSLGGRSNSLGQYSVDVSGVADTMNTYHLFCSYVSYQYSNVIIRGKIKKPVKIDIEMVNGAGSSTTEYRINPKSGRPEIVKGAQ